VEAAKGQVEQARQLEQQEQARAQSTLARFGKLNAVDQRRIREINDAGGPKSAEQANFLESKGFGASKAEAFFAERGRAAGGESALGNLGEFSSLQAATKSRIEMEQQLVQRQKEREQADKAVASAASDLRNALESMLPVIQSITQSKAD